MQYWGQTAPYRLFHFHKRQQSSQQPKFNLSPCNIFFFFTLLDLSKHSMCASDLHCWTLSMYSVTEHCLQASPLVSSCFKLSPKGYEKQEHLDTPQRLRNWGIVLRFCSHRTHTSDLQEEKQKWVGERFPHDDETKLATCPFHWMSKTEIVLLS